MSDTDRRFLMGTMEVMVLKALSWGPMHGFDVTIWIEETAGDSLRIADGTLYPALHRMEKKGWIEGRWGLSQNNRRAKYYELTRAGRRRLEQETFEWSRFAAAVGRVLSSTRAPATVGSTA